MIAGSARRCGTMECVRKCVELDGNIKHYQRMAPRITDPDILDGIHKLIEQMKAQKAALQPEQPD